jgi:hypothetical protein
MTSDTALRNLGDALERAVRRDLRSRRRAGRVLAVVAAALAIGAGAALAGGLFSAQDVEAGMPAGSALFGGTHPTCKLEADGVTYACTLASLPTEETSGDWTDAKELLTVDKHIAGGCIGRDRGGRRWDCYLGEEAVKRLILDRGLLGAYAPAPGRG